jgi:hypothetical protein
MLRQAWPGALEFAVQLTRQYFDHAFDVLGQLVLTPGLELAADAFQKLERCLVTAHHEVVLPLCRCAFLGFSHAFPSGVSPHDTGERGKEHRQSETTERLNDRGQVFF